MKTIKAAVPIGSAGLMKALVLTMFFVSLFFLNSCANLIDTAKKGDTAKVNALLNKGADVNAKDKDGKTALMAASEKGHTEIVKTLIDNGANVNAKSKIGSTALMLASLGGHTEIVQLLKKAGAKE
jgi:ankyrin repeat protein